MTIAGTPVESWRAGKARNLFQFLLFNRGQVVPRDRLYEVLWPDGDGDRSTSLKVAAHALRRILGTDEVSISYQDVGYLLRCEGVWIDIEQFEAAIEAARAAERDGDPGGALAAHHRAITLYRGDFLDGEAVQWAEEQRQWARSMVLGSLNHLRADAMRRSDPGAVITWCRADPVDRSVPRGGVPEPLRGARHARRAGPGAQLARPLRAAAAGRARRRAVAPYPEDLRTGALRLGCSAPSRRPPRPRSSRSP
nr:hypothetical protein GCM10020092_040280 [Actinoplanes digitatis]